MVKNKNTLTVEQREAFLRSQGWSDDASAEERARIESQWDDDDIEMALSLGH